MIAIFAFIPVLLCFLAVGVVANLFCKKRSLKRFVWPIAAILSWLAFFGDIIPLRIKYHYLCATEAGYEIFEPTGVTETLEDFKNKKGQVDWREVDAVFQVKSQKRVFFGYKKNIAETGATIHYKNNKVAQLKRFVYWGGSYLRSLDGGGYSVCPNIPIYREIYSLLLTRERE